MAPTPLSNWAVSTLHSFAALTLAAGWFLHLAVRMLGINAVRKNKSGLLLVPFRVCQAMTNLPITYPKLARIFW